MIELLQMYRDRPEVCSGAVKILSIFAADPAKAANINAGRGNVSRIEGVANLLKKKHALNAKLKSKKAVELAKKGAAFIAEVDELLATLKEL